MYPDDLAAWIDYRPHAGQKIFHAARERFKLLVAGARFGKSLACARDALLEMLAGRTRGWLAAPIYVLALPEYHNLRADMGRLGEAARFKRGGREGSSALRASWDAEARSVSAARPEGLLGEELDWLALCEAAHLDRDVVERYLRPRLVTRRGRLLVCTTPRGHNWVYDLYVRVLEQRPADWQALRFSTQDNPLISAGEIESAREILPADTFAEQFGGEFTGRAGRVYPEFAPRVHVRADLRPAPGEVFFKALDFGFSNPLVCLWAVLDGDGRLLVLDEYRLARATLDLHIAEIRRRDEMLTRQGYLRGPCWADPSGRLEREEFTRAGLPTLPADNALAAGINAVRERLVPRIDGVPGLLVDKTCAGLVAEFETYRYDDAPGEPLPLKHDDHALDALRYLCLALKRRVNWRGVGP